MSRLIARTALDQVVGRPALVAQHYVSPRADVGEGVSTSPMLHDLRELMSADHAAEQVAALARRTTLASAYFDEPPEQNKPFAFANGYAIIPIHGMLINRFAWSWGFVTGYNFIRAQVAAAEADPDVTGIIYDVNSYGGLVTGCQETADVIAAATKPSVAVVDANCFSAAYFLGSQAGAIRVTPSGQVGSIGVLMTHMDFSQALEQMGIAVTYIMAGSHKVDGNSTEPLSDEVRERFQAAVDATYDVFVAYVAKGRGLSEQAVRDTEALTYNAADALTIGLVDAIHNASDAVESYFAGCGDDADDDDHPETEENADMTKPPTPEEMAAAQQQAAADAAAAARTAERARISGIIGHAEAKGREDLASHLAYDTDMTPEAAAVILAKAPKAAAAPPPPPATQQETNPLKTVMDKTRQPEVGAGGEENLGEQNLSPAKRILATARFAPPTSKAAH